MLSEERATQSSCCGSEKEALEHEKDRNEEALEHEKDRNEDFSMGNWIVSSTRHLTNFQPVRLRGMPLAFCLTSYKNLGCIFTDIFSQETTITNISGLGSTIVQEMNITKISELFYVTLVYSKEGWMLFEGPDSSGLLFCVRFILLNIFSGERLHLPGYRTPSRSKNIVFSTSSSSVEYVVHVIRQERTGWTTLSIARPGDEVWEVYTKQHRHDLYCFDYNAVLISGTKVYCFGGKMIDVFDLVERHWEYITILQAASEDFTTFPAMEVDGIGLVKMLLPDANYMYRFFKLEVNEYEHLAVWVELTEQELENKSFFVGWTAPFCVKSPGREAAVYQFTNGPIRTESGRVFSMNIEVFDLKAGTRHTVFPSPMYPATQLCWVDLG